MLIFGLPFLMVAKGKPYSQTVSTKCQYHDIAPLPPHRPAEAWV